MAGQAVSGGKNAPRSPDGRLGALSGLIQAGEDGLGRTIMAVVRHDAGGSRLHLGSGVPHGDGTAHRPEHLQVVGAVAHSGAARQGDAPHQGEEGQGAALVHPGGDQLEVVVVGGGERYARQSGQFIQGIAPRLLIPGGAW